MIVGALVLILLVGREAARVTDPDSALARAFGRMLVPAALGLALVMALRFADLVLGRA